MLPLCRNRPVSQDTLHHSFEEAATVTGYSGPPHVFLGSLSYLPGTIVPVSWIARRILRRCRDSWPSTVSISSSVCRCICSASEYFPWLESTALSRSAGSWLFIIDNADDTELLFGSAALSRYLPFNRKGSVLLTTRNHDIAVRLDVPNRNMIRTAEMSRLEALAMLRNSLEERQTRDA